MAGREALIEALKEYGQEDILTPTLYSYTGFEGDEKLFRTLDLIINHNKKVLVFGDSDMDGAMAACIVRDTFEKLHFTNYTMYRYKIKSHVMTDDVVNTAIYEKYDYIIILDSSTNDLENLDKLSKFHVKPIVIDHHNPDYDEDVYNDDTIIINTILENRRRNEDLYELSGAALTFCLMYEYLSRKGIYCEDLSAYALCSLYSDSIDMTRALNRGIYYKATALTFDSIPRCIRNFMESYSVFKRRFIEYTFSPCINSLFRSEELDLLNEYLFDDNGLIGKKSLVEKIKTIHDEKRSMVAILSDEIDREDLDKIVIGNLNSASMAVEENKLYNYTGLVANLLSTEYNKPCVVLCDMQTGIKGSFRDLFSREYLPIFKQFCNAEGHGAAFGIKIPYRDFNSFIYFIKEKINKKFFLLGLREPIVIDVGDGAPDEQLLSDIAMINEFTGKDLPIVLIAKKNTMVCNKSYSKSYAYKYKWGSFYIESGQRLIPGDMIKIKPVLTKNIRLISYNRNVVI